MRAHEPELDLIDLLESSPAGSIIIDDNESQVLFWNTSVIAILGGLRGESFAAAGRTAFFQDAAVYQSARRRLAASGCLRNFEARIWREDGQEAWAAVTMRPIVFDNRSATLVWYIDITDARRRQSQLERSQGTLVDVLDQAPIGAALTDAPGRICYWNNTLLRVLDAEQGDVSAAILGGIERAQSMVAGHGQGHTFQLPLTGGALRDVAAWKAEVVFEGAPSELIWLLDVTKEREAERVAKAAVKAKSDFLATMSHEIRTPMNGVITIAELLAGTELSADQRKMLNIIRGSADGLLRVINDILDFSKAEAGQLLVENTPFRIRELLGGIRELLSTKASEKGIALGVDVDDDLADTRIGDPLRLRQVLLNLVGNAIKFTARGRVTLRAFHSESLVAFTVTDTGIGIGPDALADLFKPFRQASSDTSRRFGGTGLGLSISRTLVTLMGGDISAESSPGVGSVFTVTLPLPVTDLAPVEIGLPSQHLQQWLPPERDVAEAAAAIVLCAEDNEVNRAVLSRLLDRLGAPYVMAADGQAALECLDRARVGIVITDGHMPRLDGWQLTEAIRREEAEQGLVRLPVLMATANVMQDARASAEASGVDGFLTKPLRIAELESVLLRHLPVLASLRRPGCDDAPRDLPPAEQPAAPACAVDLSGLIELIGPSRGDLEPMLDEFVASARAAITTANSALVADDLIAVAIAAHTIKGAARYVGAAKLAALSEEIETAARFSPREAGLGPLLEALAQEVAVLPKSIEQALAAL